MSISRFIAIILFCNVYLIGQSQEFINFYPWVSGGLSASNWRSDPDPQQSGAKTGCIYSDVNIALSGGAWQTSNPQWAYNLGGMAAADGFGMKLGVNWTNVNQTVTFTITFRNAPSGAITEYPVDFSIFDINSHVCGATSLNRFIDVVSVVGYKADLTTSVNPSSIVPSCAQNIVTGNSVKGSGSCGNSETTVAFNSSNTVARIVITYSSGTGDPASLNCAGTPPQLLAGNDPRAQEIFLTPFRLIAPSSSAPTGITGTSSICSGNSTTLTATGGNSSTNWYTGSCGGTLVGTGSSITVSPGSTTTYYAANQGLCGITSCASIVVNVASPPNAGTNGVASFCSNGSSANLFASLGGSPSSSGTWSGPSSLGGGNLGTYNPVTMNPGTYTYTVTGTGGCPNATATVSVTETAPPNAGTNGTVNFCSNGSSGNLFASLGGSPSSSGTWSGPSALTGGNLGTYNPVTMTPGTYTYTVSGSGGCANATATVSVSESAAPNAGTDGSTSVCETSGSAIDLFSLITGEDTGGTWTRLTGSGGTFNAGAGTFTPAAGATTSTFQYTVSGTSPCSNDVSVATVTITSAPNAGTNGTVNFCSNGSSGNLFASLGGSPSSSGAWSGPSALTGGNLGTYNPVTMTPGTYTYTVTGSGGCANATATVSVSESAAPNAGTDGSTSVCETSGSAVDLFSLITGEDVGGTWTRLTGSGGTFNAGAGTFTPAAGATTSTFQYTVSGTSPCSNDASVATVTITSAPNAGTNGTLTICQGSTVTAAELFASLGGTPDAGGTWSPALAGAGTYTYTVTVAGCTDATAIVTVTEQVQPNAGTSGTLTVCQGTVPTNADLFAALSGTPNAGGTWSNVGLVYTYTVAATAPCTSDATATVTVTEQTQPNAGSNGTLDICQGTTVTAAQLFNALSGTPDAVGTWSPALAGAGTYTYTVAATAPCATDATAQVVVTEITAPDAGTDGTLTICQGTTVTAAELFASLGGTPDAGGTWSPALAGAGTYTYTVTVAGCTDATASVTVTEQVQPNAGTSGALTVCQGTVPTNAELFAALSGTPNAGGTWSNVGLVYTYTVAATAPCTSDATATVTVTEQAQPNAGTNGALDICQGTTVTTAELFAVLGGTPDAGGTWSPALAGAGTYTYTVAATAPCATDATAQAVVTEITAPNAGTDGTLTVCAGTVPTDAELFASLTGTPQAGGSWSNVGLVYTYTVAATAPCTSDATANVTVTEQVQPNAGTNGTLDICQGTTVTAADLFSSLTGSPDAGGTWSPALAGAGTYTYTVAATAPCATDATALVELIVSPCDIIIPTAFTPNGDNANDEWEILGLDEQYIENQVFVYNRWGSLIYESTQGDYMSNPWDGTHNMKPLPVGSYYYIIVLEEGSVPLKGTISLIME